MATATSKIYPSSSSAQNPSEIELQVAQAFLDLETNAQELKSALRPLQFQSAKELEVGQGKKAIVIFVPVPLLSNFHTIQPRLTRELEKKFSDRHVVFIAQRRILPKPGRRSRVTQKRPRSRTLTSVHEKILEDLVYPTEIVGRRIRTKEDGSKVMKVLLDPKDVGGLDWKVEGFAEVYKKLTGRSVVFEFPVQSEY
ncbi:40S ribosomal protein S7 [Drechslerella stenobrocha 248]|uniref:40S ribosomal protein S7 n=1 Tax=Drechslerella stenobrocha 248 TaxID=1043628 RepID=W7HZC2_9PEZI|nr:40S ribosomal protein S7 [Drechslerella stenobrocha 248]